MHPPAKTLYQPADTSGIIQPEGYEPACINLVTRHGARHPTSLKDLHRIEKTIVEANSLKALRPDGARLLRMTKDLLRVEQANTPGSLSERGGAELAGIGRRMARHYPEINRSENILVRATKQERTRQSARAFFKGFGQPYPQSGSPFLNENDSVNLRFYDLAPAYLHFEKKGSWQPFAAKLEQSTATVSCIRTIVRRWFDAGYAAQLLREDRMDDTRDFVRSVYSTAAIEQAIISEIKDAGFSPDSLDMTALFHCDELQQLEALSDAEGFLVKGPGTDASGIQVKIAAPLLADFIKTSDSMLGTRRPGAMLRFAHAETIAPFATLTGIAGAATPATDVLHFSNVWSTAQVIPFAANIQWVFYRSKTGEGPELVTVLMNEKPVRIPVATKNFPFYPWPAVKAFYLQRLARMGLTPGSDRYGYLLGVQE